MNKFPVKIWLSAIIAAIISVSVSCVKQDFDTPPVKTLPKGEITSIQKIVENYSGKDITFDTDASLYAKVMMDEKSGNIYKTVYISDGKNAIAVHTKSSGGLSQGDSIRLYMKDLVLTSYMGLLQLDAKNKGGIETDKHTIKIDAGLKAEPISATIDEVLSGKLQSKLVKIDNVQFIKSDIGKTYADADNKKSENRTIENCEGKSIIIRTSGYAKFAGEKVPEGNGSIVGIVGVYRDDIQFYIRSIEEIKMTKERCKTNNEGGSEPVETIDEDFSSAPNNKDLAINGWTTFNEEGSRNWQGKVFDKDGSVYVQASGYKSTDASNVMWLISPPITLAEGHDKMLRFESAKAYYSHDGLSVWISTDYKGGSTKDANWIELTAAKLIKQSDPDHTFISSGNIDLSAYKGTAYIAFKYVGNGTDKSGTFRIDNVKVKAKADMGDDTGGGGSSGGDENTVETVNEDFSSITNEKDVELTGWTMVKEAGTRQWRGKVFKESKYAQASGYKSTDESLVMWMITPTINVPEGHDKVLSFKSAQSFYTHDGLSVWISQDFSGDITKATWTKLNATIAGKNDEANKWIESGKIDLSAYKGTINIAFKYEGSNVNTGTFRIDDVKVMSEKEIDDGGTGGGGDTGGDAVESLNEDFSSVTNQEDVSVDGWTVIKEKGTRSWRSKIFKDEKYVQATAYKSTDTQNIMWLITPAVELTAGHNKKLKFKSSKAYYKHDGLEVYVLTTFDGSDIAGATKIKLNPKIAGENDADHAWVESGDVDLSSYSGKIYIAFKYTGDKTNSTTIKLDDITIQ